MTELRCDISREDETLTFKLYGDLDLHVAPELRQVLDRELGSPLPASVIVDLAGTSFIDSSIIATLIVALKTTLAAQAQFRVVNCQQAVRDTFEIAGLLERFRIT